MKKMINSAAMSAFAVVKSMIVIVLCAVLGGSVMVSCDTESDIIKTDKPDNCPTCPPDKPVNPDKKVTAVNKMGCDLKAINWKEENCSFVATKSGLRSASGYDIKNRNFGVVATTNYDLLNEVVYSDESTETGAAVNFNSVAQVSGYGFNTKKLFKYGTLASLATEEPTMTSKTYSDGVEYTFTWSNGFKAMLFNTLEADREIRIHGFEMDPCLNGFGAPVFEGATIQQENGTDSRGSKNIYVEFVFTSSLSDGKDNTRSYSFVAKNLWEAAQGQNPDDGNDDDRYVVKYVLDNEKPNGDNYTGDLVAIYDDLSQKVIENISFTRKHSYINDENREKTVNELSYTASDAIYSSNVASGNSRTVNGKNVTIELSPRKDIVRLNTNRGSMTQGINWEYPVIIVKETGEKLLPKYDKASVSNDNISDNGVSNNRLPINMSATASYGSESRNLSSTLTLIKSNDQPEDPTIVIGEEIRDQRIDGSYICWTHVVEYNNTNSSETNRTFPSKFAISGEVRKATTNRNYGITTPEMKLTGSETKEEGDITYTVNTYEQSYNFASGLSYVITSKAIVKLYQKGQLSNNKKLEVWNAEPVAKKDGETLGTQNISTDANWNKYIDKHNHSLSANGYVGATCVQEVEYSEKVETPVDPTPEDKVTEEITEGRIEDGKWYYTYTVTHSVNTELNSSEEDYVEIPSAMTITPVNGWTCKANEAGFSLTGNTNQAYSVPGNYTFASNRGNNTAYASVQTSYVVSKGNVTKTLSGTASVVASASRVASTETSNTYAINGELYLNGVLVNSASAEVVETIEANQEPVDPNKVTITSVDCTVGVTESGYAGIVFVAHYSDGVSVSSTGATGNNGGNTVINGEIGLLTQIGDNYIWGGTVIVPIHDFTYNGYGSPFIGCVTTTNEDGSVSCVSNQGGATFTFPAR